MNTSIYEAKLLAKGKLVSLKKDKKLNTRNMILETAEGLFKKYGIESSGIKKIMNEIGLTVGGFYSHFKSKDDLIKNSLNRSLESTMKDLLENSAQKQGKDRINSILGIYLGEDHSNNIEEGCPIAAMNSDITRCNDEIKKEVENFFDSFYLAIKDDVTKMNEENEQSVEFSREDFYVYLSMSLGSVVMSRIVTDKNLSSQILKGAKEKILRDFA
ncbi:MAG: TetR/AcrR family transcriptional repressor of nem operon [Thermoproteota archaeon]|jgi:TetR/AcrR family transcriptional repressor of nem operon